MYRLASMLMLSTMLGACTVLSPERTRHASLDQLVQPTVEMNARGASGTASQGAIATLPEEAGRIENVKRQQYSDGTWQTIEYDQTVPGLKKNAIDIRLHTTTAVALLEPVAIEKPSESGIRAELATYFPRMQMRIVENPRSNAYGVYGLAVGTWANGVRCIYAWQWIDNLKTSETHEAISASLRVRVCRRGATLDQLAGLIDGVRVEPSRGRDIILAGSTEPAASGQQPPARKVLRPRPRSVNSVVLHRTPISSHQSASPAFTLPNGPASVSPETALDPSLPAAAYRGPVVAATTRATSR